MRRVLLPLLIVPAMLLAGCFGLETDVEVNEDGSGSQTLRMTVPTSLLEIAGEDVPSTEELQADFESDPETQAIRDALAEHDGSLEFFASEDGESFGFELKVDVPASDDFAAEVKRIVESLPEGEFNASDFTPADFTLEKQGDEWVFSTSFEEITADTLGEMAGDPAAAAMAEQFLSQMTFTYRLDLPGEVVEHNADEVEEDGTLIWSLTGDEAAGTTLSARSDVSSGLNTPLIAGLIVAGLLVAGLIALFLMRRRTAATSIEPAEPPVAPPPAAPTV